jgi:atypical dual specificity phosphatase
LTVKNFSWVLPGQLAGSGIPGHFSNDETGLRCDIEELSKSGVKHLVSLQMPHESIERVCKVFEIEWRYFPIPDFGIPENKTTFALLIDEIIEKIKRSESVCVHCHAGVGRTGMVLSCVMGKLFTLCGKKAIAAVRRTRQSLDTDLQEQFVISFLGEYEY